MTPSPTPEAIAREIFKTAISGLDGHGCVWEAGEQEKMESAIARGLTTTRQEALESVRKEIENWIVNEYDDVLRKRMKDYLAKIQEGEDDRPRNNL